MEALKVVLVANRGEIAVRLINAARRLAIQSIAIYTEPDSASAHLSLADKAFQLAGPPSTAYLDIDQIIHIAKANSVDAVVPGYGFLSENPDFARKLSQNGITFVGPAADTIEALGLKHTAREHAIAAGVPVVPGSQGLIENEDEAVRIARQLKFPVMLKATAGGGGMGLMTCETEQEVRLSFQKVQSRGETLFKNAGVFLERYFPRSHHIEVQMFGNGMGKAISIGERECSIQRRHQKVIEECPSPFVENNKSKFPNLRRELTKSAVALAESLHYASAGTVEYLVDDETGSFFYLETNTRLQVEHGITEMCYNVDLVELMYRQADAQISGRGGIDEHALEELQQRCLEPQGHAIELRLCAENPARDYAPSPGVLQKVEWHQLPETRIDTWVRTGLTVSANYDPLLAKIMHRAATRADAVAEILQVAVKSVVCGPPNNLDFLAAILQSADFVCGNTITTFLDSFDFYPSAIDVLSGGAYTLIQDFPGRPTIGRGFGHSGPMDPIAFKCANLLVGNDTGTEALEITLTGPTLNFLGGAIIALCGPATDAMLDGTPLPPWTAAWVRAGQRLTIGKVFGGGCRAYLAVRGGFLNVPRWFGSKATNPSIGVGGYQGRALKSGDFLTVDKVSAPPVEFSEKVPRIPDFAQPQYTEHWDIQVMGGPYEEGYLSSEDLDMVYTTTWKISHNASRGGIRLIGPRPKWARPDGGEGGAHPSNVIEHGYPLGGLNWTGDEPVIFPMDCPDFGGFLCSLTVTQADLWKVGQLKPGGTLRFHRVSFATALDSRRQNNTYLEEISAALDTGSFKNIRALNSRLPTPLPPRCTESAVLQVLDESETNPHVSYRQSGDNYLLIDYGKGSLDLNHKCRATALARKLRDNKSNTALQKGLLNTVCCGNSLMVYYDGLQLAQKDLLQFMVSLESELGSLRDLKLPNRTFSLPITFTHDMLTLAMERYMCNQRPYASYLPDNLDFVARNNGVTPAALKAIFLQARFVAVGVGFVMGLPQCLPADPRHRLQSPKQNPSRTWTPEGAVSWGGSCMALYNAEGPGGYMLCGMSIPGVDTLAYKPGFSPDRPWLFDDMDVITFHEVSEEAYMREMALWKSGRYHYCVENTVFDMEEHNALLKQTEKEVQAIRMEQRKHQNVMQELEASLLAKWDTEKTTDGFSRNEVEKLLQDPDIKILEAPVSANIWRLPVKEGDQLQTKQILAVLEAMKLEINVFADEHFHDTVVEKVLVKPGDTVESGEALLLARKVASTLL